MLLLTTAAQLLVGCLLTLDTDALTSGRPDAASDSGAAEDATSNGGSDAATADANDAGASPSPCPDGGAGHCYFLIDEYRRQAEAKAACSALGAHLVTITSAAEQAEVAAIGAGEARWIGLEATKSPPNGAADFAWLTSESYSYQNWVPGNPSDGESCAVIASDFEEQWVDRECTDRYRPICEYEP